MKKQVAGLFEMEYKVSVREFEEFMSRLYEHPYQAEKSIKIVAADGDKIVGFQSFFYWPYTYKDKIFNSYQSGNSLVHQDYRGKRLFARMLDFINNVELPLSVDFLMGFPVQASYNSFIKNKWNNLFDLQWYIKPLNPLAFLFPGKRLERYLLKGNKENAAGFSSFVRLSEETGFRSWKAQLNNASYYQFRFEKEGKDILFDLKVQKRKRIITELVIGSIRYTDENSKFLGEAFEALVGKVKKAGCVSMLSYASNDLFQHPDIKQILVNNKFKKIDKKIYFIIKPLKPVMDIEHAGIWNAGRADIDTW